MIIKQSLIWATKILKKSKILFPALDAEILLSFAVKKPKEFLYAHSEKKLAKGHFNKFKKLVARRAKYFPVAYLTGHKYFYGLDFFVNKDVLIPRPETETLVEEVLKIAKFPPHLSPLPTGARKLPLPSGERVGVRGNQSFTIVDVGTGSGAIAITLAHHLPKAKIFATEISLGAKKVARKNILRHKAAVTLLRGNLLEPLIKSSKYKVASIKYLLIVANLPYLNTKQWQKTQPEIKKYEPRQALDGGADGLKYYKQLLNQIKLLITNYPLPITSLFEIDPSQTKHIIKLIHQYFGKSSPSRLRGFLRFCDIKKDLAGRDRVVIFKINPKKQSIT